MVTLALSSSSSQGSIALAKDAKVVFSHSWQKQSSHSEIVTSVLSDAFSEVKMTATDIDLFVCTQGPGSFTGLRVGISVVRTLAQIKNRPIIGIDDPLAIALNAPTSDLPHLVLIDAQKNKVFCGIYRPQIHKVETLLTPTLLSLKDVEDLLVEPHYIALGETDSFKKFFSPSSQEKLLSLPEVSPYPLAEIFLSYVLLNRSDFATQSWQQLLPKYLRASAAEEVAAEKISKNK